MISLYNTINKNMKNINVLKCFYKATFFYNTVKKYTYIYSIIILNILYFLQRLQKYKRVDKFQLKSSNI